MTGIEALAITNKKARISALDIWFSEVLRLCRKCGKNSTIVRDGVPLCPRCAAESSTTILIDF